MSTPSATNKRRRIDAANVTLRKPFHSPVIRRPENSTPASSKTPQQPKPATPDQHPSRAPGTTAPRPTETPPPRRRAPPLTLPTPVALHSSSSSSSRTPRTPRSAVGGGGTEDPAPHPGAALLALVRGHRASAARQDAVLAGLARRAELARQARRIEGAGAGAGAVDAELRALVAQWRAAGRAAAEEVFAGVRERVANSGGPKAWKEMRRRQMEFYQGWDQDEGPKRKRWEEDGEQVELEEDLEGNDDGGGAAQEQALQAKKEADEAEEEEGEIEFNMTQMLQSLNIDPEVLGYDEAEDKWID